MERFHLSYVCTSLILEEFNRARKVTENDNKGSLVACANLFYFLSLGKKEKKRQNEQSVLFMTSVEKMNRDYLFTVSPNRKEADIN